jgi:HNH endonuclease
MNIPVKPFPTYKWRWLSVQPSESLLKAPFLLGVLRALQRNEGRAYSSQELYEDLLRVQEDLNLLQENSSRRITLARPPERNLFRNSGQYWRGTGLVLPNPGTIQLTELGHSVASGQVTNDEFAALMVRNTVLPNPLTYSAEEIQKWRDSNLRIKPFELILTVMNELGESFDPRQAYISPDELIRIVIPLAGVQSEVVAIAETLDRFRRGNLDNISLWPDCAPDANDKRLAREFLLFLKNFDICRSVNTDSQYKHKFYLDQLLSTKISPDEDMTFLEDFNLLNEELSNFSSSEIPAIIERRRVSTSVIQRPNQARFRRNVLDAANQTCILTRETTPDVLEAAHIIPVQYGGIDDVDNGLCMRVDIHRLFDGGRIRISPDGSVTLSEHITTAISYADLPRSINFPPSVSQANIEWRSRYL